MEFSAEQLWSHVLEEARERLNPQAFGTWLSGTRAVALTEDELLVEVPSEFHVEWVGAKYGDQLAGLVEGILNRSLSLSFQCSDNAPELPIPTVELSAPSAGGTRQSRDRSSPHPTPTLNDRYTFDRFVVGNNSQFAAAACRAVAEQPAKAYNPLFLYGGVGLGKTHLMHAIGRRLLEETPNARVVYLTTEQFTNDLVSAIQSGTTADFRRRYRQIDLLLVDDVQFLAGKERTQEEFFHTFNALYDAHKQIILTSDRPPKEIGGLEGRLVSRFEWGLVADIRSPDYETRVAILRKKGEDDRISIDEDVIDFVARACTNSVRELEGAIIKLLAYSSLTNQEITVELARRSLQSQGAGSAGSRNLTAERIQDFVAEEWGVRPDALASKRRTKDITVPRQVAMYLIRELLDMALAQIGDLFGGRDHSTVIHSINKVEGEMEEDPDFRARVEAIRDELRRP